VPRAAPVGREAFVAKPAIVIVDDDPDVLRAVERDLRRRYTEN
jgi:thioredoxin reductase (NADPH)